MGASAQVWTLGCLQCVKKWLGEHAALPWFLCWRCRTAPTNSWCCVLPWVVSPSAPRPDAYTQRVLSACAKLQGARDPVLCLSFCTMLLGTAAPDVNPSYLGSQAAGVLLSQLLQVQPCDLSDPAAVSDAMCAYESDMGGLAPGRRPKPEPVLFERVLRAATQGPLRRQLLAAGLGEAGEVLLGCRSCRSGLCACCSAYAVVSVSWHCRCTS